MSVDHYENFPVASLLLPAALREPVSALYVFARSADDFSDEGNLPPAERLALLDGYRLELHRLARGEPSEHPVFQRLAPVIRTYHLPFALFHDLLDAFAQDVSQTSYADFTELLDYCRRSANPVGRLMLCLFGVSDAESLRQSDAICTALQLINHWQDVAIDLKKNDGGRIYLPRDEMEHFGVSLAQLHAATCDNNFRALMQFQVNRARTLMLGGAPLGRRITGRCGLELRSIVAGGLRILDRIEAAGYDVFRHRPVLTPLDWTRILATALLSLSHR
jgi:squalene synthase HpnC